MVLHLLYRDSYIVRYEYPDGLFRFRRVGVLAPAVRFAFGPCSAAVLGAVVRELPLVRAVTCHPNSIVRTFRERICSFPIGA